MKKIITLVLLSTLLLLSKTLVTVNGHKITDSLLSPTFKQLDEQKQQQLIEQLIKEEIIYANLLKTPLVKSQAFIDAFNQQKQLVEKQYGKKLNKEQLRSIKGAIVVSLYQQELFQKAKAKVSEIKDFYNNNPKLMTYPNSIEIANIVLKDKKTANSVLKALKGSANLDKAFIEMAHKHKQNGYMGWFGRASVPTNLFDKAYKLKPKHLLPTAVKTKHGYNVLYLINKKPAGKLTFKEAKPKIEQLLKKQKVMQTLQNKVEKLYGEAEIVY